MGGPPGSTPDLLGAEVERQHEEVGTAWPVLGEADDRLLGARGGEAREERARALQCVAVGRLRRVLGGQAVGVALARGEGMLAPERYELHAAGRRGAVGAALALQADDLTDRG